MTDLRTAAQQALEALELLDRVMQRSQRTDAAITALKAALAEPVQEPVGVLRTLVQIHPDGTETWREDPVWITPPQRKPLTEEEIKRIDDSTHFHESPDWSLRFARAIERALKEKNHE